MQDIFLELIEKQKCSVPFDKKFSIQDFKRLNKYIDKSIFNDSCTIWHGYKTFNKDSHASYNNFYFNNKKHALHRLLYVNFVDDLQDCEYIKFNCANKGVCCNVNHLTKIKNIKKIKQTKECKNKEVSDISKIVLDKIIVYFD